MSGRAHHPGDPVDPSPLHDLLAARLGIEAADVRLREAVAAARADGASWAQVGAVLGTTRQAAFKRFGTPRDPRGGAPMTAGTSTTYVAEVTERIFTLIDAGSWDPISELLDPSAADVLTREAVLGTWARAVAETGNLVEVRDVRVETAGGALLGPEEQVHGMAVGAAVLACEAGEWQGRCAVVGTRVVGLLVVAPDATDLPF